MIVHEAARTGGFGGEIAALIAERGLDVAACADRARHRLRYGDAAAAARAALHARRSAASSPLRAASAGSADAIGGSPCASSYCPIWARASRRPRSSPGMSTEGDHVVADQPLVSVETDKAVVEVPSPQSGRIARLFGPRETW